MASGGSVEPKGFARRIAHTGHNVSSVSGWNATRQRSQVRVATVMSGQCPTEREWQPATAVSAGEPYVFLAGEAGLVKAMRRLAVDAAGIPKGSVAFMGYWRRGAAES